MEPEPQPETWQVPPDEVLLAGTGLGSAMDGEYERCSFAGMPHSQAVLYADPYMPAWYCEANRCAIYRSHSQKHGEEWIGRWVVKDSSGYTRFRTIAHHEPVPPSGSQWEPYSGKISAPTPDGPGGAMVVAHQQVVDRHDVPPYWPVHRPLSDVTLIPVDDDTLRSAQSVPGWSGPAHPAHTLRPDLGWDDAPLDAQVRKLFESGGLAAASIVRIDAVVNAPMMCIFQNVRASMHIKLGRKRTREAWLWHGTAYDNLGKICTSGFDRSFGRTEAYGHGVYFARNSQYSASPTYSPPDANGVQYMILSRVLVGEAIVGKGSYSVPQPKPEPRAMENFESFVDNLEKPSIVVSTRDFMAIPEFIIAFTNRGIAGHPRPQESVSYKIGVAL